MGHLRVLQHVVYERRNKKLPIPPPLFPLLSKNCYSITSQSLFNHFSQPNLMAHEDLTFFPSSFPSLLLSSRSKITFCFFDCIFDCTRISHERWRVRKTVSCQMLESLSNGNTTLYVDLDNLEK